MNITDSPYPVGTPEHGEWVRTVFIPTELYNPERARTDAMRAGAESIGGSLIHGAREDRVMDELERLCVQAVGAQSLRHLTDPAPNAWRTITYAGYMVRPPAFKFTDITAT